MNPYMIVEYSGFSTIPLGQRFTDYHVCTSMAPFNPLWIFGWNSPECFQYCLFVTLFCRNQINNSLDLGYFTNEYLNRIVSNKN